MGLIRRNKKGSDTIVQNSDKWELMNEEGQAVRADIDFTQLEVPKIAPENLKETADEVVPNGDTPKASVPSDNAKKKVSKPWIKHFDAYIIKKFLGTFFFAILVLLAIVIVFAINEKLDSLKAVYEVDEKDVDAVSAAVEELQKVWYPAMERIYKESSPQSQTEFNADTVKDAFGGAGFNFDPTPGATPKN